MPSPELRGPNSDGSVDARWMGDMARATGDSPPVAVLRCRCPLWRRTCQPKAASPRSKAHLAQKPRRTAELQNKGWRAFLTPASRKWKSQRWRLRLGRRHREVLCFLFSSRFGARRRLLASFWVHLSFLLTLCSEHLGSRGRLALGVPTPAAAAVSRSESTKPWLFPQISDPRGSGGRGTWPGSRALASAARPLVARARAERCRSCCPWTTTR